ncbi:MAG TPA: L-lactate permease [Candidatus Limnocylindrales bacterium]|nr:L-lactate permease [Candidatus Limnocylindrales bacterium]
MEGLPLDLWHWGLALAPLLLLLVLLVGLRWTAPEAGPIGMFLAIGIAFLAFDAPAEVIAIAGGKGMWDAVFVLYVVWSALLLYRVVERAGGFHALREGISEFSRNDLFLVLGFGWVFASFLQGIAGFGVPIAVVAPLLVGLGVKPLYAVVIPLIGHAWANLFGTLAVAWLATTRVVNLDDPVRTALETAILLWIPNLLAGVAIAWLYGRGEALRMALPLILIVSAIHGGGQLAMSLVQPVLAGFVPAALALVALYPLSHWRRYSEPDEDIDRRPAMAEDRQHDERQKEPTMGLGLALLPYGVVIVSVLALALPPVTEALEAFEIGPPFGAAETGLGLEVEAEDAYSPFAPLTHPGTFLMLAAGVAWLVYHLSGHYDAWAERADTKGLLQGVVDNAIPASVAVCAFLVMSKVMDDTGQTDVLAGGIAEVAPAAVYAALAAAIGGIGSFMTSSNTASNILFAPLQVEAAGSIDPLRESTMVAAQNAGGAIGNSISPANVVLGTGTAGIVGREGDVLRRVLPWAGASVLLVGAATVALNWLG